MRGKPPSSPGRICTGTARCSSPKAPRQRLIKAAIRDGVIIDEQRFSLYDLKRKGGTDIAGNVAEKQTALGVSPAMMKVYDLSVPRVKPSAPK
jgi:hypothetical protein